MVYQKWMSHMVHFAKSGMACHSKACQHDELARSYIARTYSPGASPPEITLAGGVKHRHTGIPPPACMTLMLNEDMI